MPEDPPQETAERGSIIAVLGTDAPLSPLALRHLARRASLGVARGGTPGGNSSGDIFLAFSVANPGPMPDDAPAFAAREEMNIAHLDDLYLAAVEAVEEAVVNALVAGEDVPTVKPPGRLCPALDPERLREIFGLEERR